MTENDRFRLTHMLEAATDVLEFTAGVARQDFFDNKMMVLAVSRCLEIIGEAANHIAPETRALAPDMPWPAIIGMRNRVVHGYWVVDASIIWDTASLYVPALIPQLERLLATSPETASKPPA